MATLGFQHDQKKQDASKLNLQSHGKGSKEILPVHKYKSVSNFNTFANIPCHRYKSQDRRMFEGRLVFLMMMVESAL